MLKLNVRICCFNNLFLSLVCLLSSARLGSPLPMSLSMHLLIPLLLLSFAVHFPDLHGVASTVFFRQIQLYLEFYSGIKYCYIQLIFNTKHSIHLAFFCNSRKYRYFLADKFWQLCSTLPLPLLYSLLTLFSLFLCHCLRFELGH